MQSPDDHHHSNSVLNDAFDGLQLQPPPLCHQRSGDRYDHRDSLVYSDDLGDLPPQPPPLCHQRSASRCASFRNRFDDEDSFDDNLPLQPPPLCHQRSGDRYDLEEPSWMCSSSFSLAEGEPSGWDDEPDEPVWRSSFPYCMQSSGLDLASTVTSMVTSTGSSSNYGESDAFNRSWTSKSSWEEPLERFSADHGFLSASDPRLSQRLSMSGPMSGREGSSPDSPCQQRAPQKGFVFELPLDLFDTVLGFLPCHPGLFAAMSTSRFWRDAARLNYGARQLRVPAYPDALLRAVAESTPGDTLLLAPGLHALSTELVLEHPLRLLGVQSCGCCESLEVCTCCPNGSHQDTPESLDMRFGASDAAPVCPAEGADAAECCTAESCSASEGAVICSPQHVLLRSRCASHLAGLTLCRMGDEVGYPNTVAFAEVGRLTIESCRITCGGDAMSVEEALRAFDGAPTPGQPLQREAEAAAASRAGVSGSDAETSHSSSREAEASAGRPQSGVWVGSAASVLLRRNLILGTAGPGVKIYRGELEAEENTIAFSGTGANIVANGGRVELRRNEIAGASGDGVSAWNDTCMRIDSNRIHSNSGSGIAVNSTAGREVAITDNIVFNNSAAAVQFVKGHMPEALVSGNAFAANGCGAQPGAQFATLPVAPPIRRVSSEPEA